MTPEAAVHIIGQAFWTTVLVIAPLLLIGFAVGIVVNIIQIATSLQDAAFSTIPRLAAFLFGFLLLMPWMLKQISAYSISIFADLSRYAR
ncbi:MAG TPA: flagellar biosynthetic protein FliQ [Bryobacteraceae bacterium]|nr:flagellar biosynthetic protein FliQ [Bryobacteraceae bacterium]